MKSRFKNQNYSGLKKNGLLVILLFWLCLNAGAQEPVSPPSLTTTTQSTGFNCLPFIEIEHFRDNATKKDWKVVIGRKIQYRANPKDMDPYTWILGDLVQGGTLPYWTLDNDGNTPYESPDDRKGKMYIPESQLPQNNYHLGPAHGALECYADGANGIEFDQKQVEVFFEKDETSPIAPVYSNWFYYWRQLILDRLEGITFRAYNMDNDPDMDPTNGDEGWEDQEILISLTYGPNHPSFVLNNYGFSQKLGQTNITLANFQATETVAGEPVTALTTVYATIGLGDLCSRACAQEYTTCSTMPNSSCNYGGTFNINANNTLKISTGIHCFLRVIEHELEHVRIFAELWTNHHYITGAGALHADADNDSYPDAWEVLADQIPFGFSTGDGSDAYGAGATGYLPTDYPGNTTGASAGSNYEENRCRDHEHAIDETALDEWDWSYDTEYHNSQFQGKNWND